MPLGIVAFMAYMPKYAFMSSICQQNTFIFVHEFLSKKILSVKTYFKQFKKKKIICMPNMFLEILDVV